MEKEVWRLRRERLENWDFKDCVGPGWHELLDEILTFLRKEKEKGHDIQILQVKEKFGGLRVYVTGLTEEADRELWALADKSVKICEECGASGQIRSSRGWLRSVCDTHYAIWNREEEDDD